MGFTHKLNINVGDRFGKLVVIRELEERSGKSICYECLCDCGNTTIAKANLLKNGKKDNCGCMTKIKQKNAKRKYNLYEFLDDYVVGYTTKKEKFFIDYEDFNKIKNYCWNVHDGYLVANGLDGKKELRIHRLIMGLEYGNKLKVDHINHNTLDNRRCNLRITTNQENCFNHKAHSNNTSGYSGVGYRKEIDKWRVRIYVDGKCICLGNYDTKEEAIQKRLEAEKKYYGEYQYEFNK